MRDVDEDYYRQRLADERESAKRADTDVARAVHSKLAELYAARLAEPAPNAPWRRHSGRRTFP